MPQDYVMTVVKAAMSRINAQFALSNLEMIDKDTKKVKCVPVKPPE